MVDQALSFSLLFLGIGAVAAGFLLHSKGKRHRGIWSLLLPVGLIIALLGTLLIFVPDFFQR